MSANHFQLLLGAVLAALFFHSPQGDAYPIHRELIVKAEKLAIGKKWHRLMHYRRGLLGNLRSDVDGPDFFFASDGKTNPQSEMLASIEAMDQLREIGPLKQHPQCAFPARYRFLKSHLSLNIKDVPCPDFEEWLASLDPESATLVFASNYPNHPVSIFGHTFFRINSKVRPGKSKSMGILNYGVGYNADSTSGLGFQFALNATFGGGPGQFAIQPYYMKVREYSDAESRDLWEYDLHLNSEQTTEIVSHIWEIETTSYISYYFVDENCAYQLLALIEVARPDLELTSQFPVYALPSETIKTLLASGAVKDVNFRPSLRKKMYGKMLALNGEDRDLVKRIVNGQESLAKQNNSDVLEAATSLLYYRKQRLAEKYTDKEGELFRSTLARRAMVGGTTSLEITDYLKNSSPELSHHSFRMGGGIGTEGENLSYNFHLKLALHDLLDVDAGFAPLSQTDFGVFYLRYLTQEKKLLLDEFDLVQVFSVFPIDEIDKDMSWRVEVAVKTPRDLDCYPCHTFSQEAAIGTAVQLGAPNLVGYSLMLAGFDFGGAINGNMRFLPGIEFGSIYSPVSAYKLQGVAKVKFDVFQSVRQSHFFQYELNQSYAFGPAWSLRALYSYTQSPSSQVPGRDQLDVQLNYYF